jgi:hypothetical protein
VQGEADRQADSIYRITGQYKAALDEVILTVREIAQVDVFIGVTSSCPNPADLTGPALEVRNAQFSAISKENRIFFGADLDAVKSFTDRFDSCHFTDAGAKKIVSDWTASIENSISEGLIVENSRLP